MSAIQLGKDKIGLTEILLRCDCHDLTHLASFGHFDDEQLLFLEIAYDHHTPLWRRVWISIKYLLGLRQQSCGEIVLTLDDARTLKAFLEEFISAKPDKVDKAIEAAVEGK